MTRTFLFLSLFVREIEVAFISTSQFQSFLDFLQNRKSSNFPSVGPHFLLRLHISLVGLYSYEQHSDISVQAFVHLERCFVFSFVFYSQISALMFWCQLDENEMGNLCIDVCLRVMFNKVHALKSSALDVSIQKVKSLRTFLLTCKK